MIYYVANEQGFAVKHPLLSKEGFNTFHCTRNVRHATPFSSFIEADEFAKHSGMVFKGYTIFTPSHLHTISEEIRTHYIANREGLFIRVIGGKGFRQCRNPREAYPFESISEAEAFMKTIGENRIYYVVLSPFGEGFKIDQN